MKYFIIISILISLWTKFNQVHEVNEIKTEAEIAFKNGNHIKVIALYTQLINSFKLKDENLRLNLAHSYYKINQVSNASYHYKILTNSSNNITRSVAFHQLAMIYGSNGKQQLALSYFREAIKTNPDNEKARYNYEIIKKVLDQDNKLNIGQRNKQEQIEGNKNKESNIENSKKEKEEKNPDLNNSSDKEKTEFQPDKTSSKNKEALKTRLIELNISEEKAKIILESMKNAEIQYLQQRRHHEYNQEYKNKPNW